MYHVMAAPIQDILKFAIFKQVVFTINYYSSSKMLFSHSQKSNQN